MTFLKSFAALAVASIALSAGSAQAGLIDNGMTTFDTAQNLIWLDLTESTDRSYNDLIGVDGTNEFAVGGDFEGFRHATAAEVTVLFSNAGFAPNYRSSPATQQMLDLILLLGRTSFIPGETDGFFSESFGLLDSGPSPLSVAIGQLLNTTLVTPIFTEDFDAANFAPGFSPRDARPSRGHWLVRRPPSVVPEPSALILFGSSVVLLGAMRRRKRGH